MKNAIRAVLLGAVVVGSTAAPAAAQPTGLFIVPTTDTQKAATVRADVTPSYARRTLINGGVQLGVTRRTEAGVDSIGPRSTNNLFNAKVRVHDEGTITPALAVGIRDAGREATFAPAPNMAYAVAGKHLGPVRVTAGAYRFSNAFARYSSSAQRSGTMLAVDGTRGVLHPALEHLSGRNPYGMTVASVGYQIRPNVMVAPGYVFYNDHNYGTNGLRLQARVSFGK